METARTAGRSGRSGAEKRRGFLLLRPLRFKIGPLGCPGHGLPRCPYCLPRGRFVRLGRCNSDLRRWFVNNESQGGRHRVSTLRRCTDATRPAGWAQTALQRETGAFTLSPWQCPTVEPICAGLPPTLVLPEIPSHDSLAPDQSA